MNGIFNITLKKPLPPSPQDEEEHVVISSV